MQVTTSEEERSGWCLVSCPATLRWSVNRTYWSIIDKVLRSRSLMEPCSAWGRKVISIPVSRAVYYFMGFAGHTYLQQSSDCGTRLLVA